MQRALLLLVLTVGGCLRSTQYQCTSNEQCGAGRCEAIGFCSFADATCDGTGFRFGDASGALSNTCVQGDGGIDAGVDAEVDAPVPPIDTPPGNCPGDYITLPNTPPDHRYKLITVTANFANAQATCAGMSSYLAIPDDVDELAAHATQIAAGRHWIGVTDTVTEGTFVNVKGMPAFVQFDTGAGEPDNNGDQDCVAVEKVGADNLMYTEKCGPTTLVYLCECEDG